MSANLTQEEIDRCIQQAQRKKEYNRQYYHNRVKVKRESEQQELIQLRQDYQNLQNHLKAVQQVIYDQVQADFEADLESLSDENATLLAENERLTKIVANLQRDNKLMQSQVEHARKQLYDMMMEKADDILPRVTLNPQPLNSNHH